VRAGAVLLVIAWGLMLFVPRSAIAEETPPWWEGSTAQQEAWKLDLNSEVEQHMRGWGVPLATVGGIGVVNLGIGLYLLDASPFVFSEGLILVGAVMGGGAALLSSVAFPSLRGIELMVKNAPDPDTLYIKLQRVRKTLGWVSFGLGMGAVAFGVAIPFTFGVSGVFAGGLLVASAALGHASITALVFEQKVAPWVGSRRGRSRFGALPRHPAPPRLASIGPTGLTFIF